MSNTLEDDVPYNVTSHALESEPYVGILPNSTSESRDVQLCLFPNPNPSPPVLYLNELSENTFKISIQDKRVVGKHGRVVATTDKDRQQKWVITYGLEEDGFIVQKENSQDVWTVEDNRIILKPILLVEPSPGKDPVALPNQLFYFTEN